SAYPASSDQLSLAPGTPSTPRPPSPSTSMSSTAASSLLAASSLALATRSSLASRTALPPICNDRDPPVPPPRGTCAVSDCTKSICSTGMPRASEASMAKDVGWPWPCPDVPTLTVARPSALISTAANSPPPPPPVISTQVLTPMPSNTASPAPLPRCCSLRSSS